MLVTGLLTLQTMFVGVGALGGIIHVPAEAPTIQIAIEESQPFDTIIVAPGTYYERINFLGKAITVRSSGGAAVTTIDATGLAGDVVICTSGETPGTVLDGLTITGGAGTTGRGMYNWGSSPTVANCTFTGNTGCGMYDYYANPTVTQCTFTGNTGRGMCNGGGSPTVANCTFSRNMGGGMSNGQSSPTITNCMFIENSATSGGGMYNNSTGSPKVARCTFNGNKASNQGGAMYNDYGARPVLTNCMFSGNAAVDGGGISNYQSSPTLMNCTFAGNVATGRSGGMDTYIGFPIVSQCIFWGNSPYEVRNPEYSTSITFRFSDVRGGLPTGAANGGGNIDLDPMFMRTPNPGPDGTWNGVDDDYGDLHLREGSPCIDAGDPSFGTNPSDPTDDLDGNPRIVGTRVDIGTYEFQVPCDGPDFDGDGIPDVCDRDIDDDGVPNVIDACDFTPPGVPVDDQGRPRADLNLDCEVDLRDYAIFQNSMIGP